MDGLDESAADKPYLTTTHLREAQSIGPIPVRTFFVVLGSTLILGVPVATLGRHAIGDGGLWLGLVPVLLATPLGLPFFDPPAEHGLLKLLAFMAAKVASSVWLRLPPRRELVEADGLWAFLQVLNQYRRSTLGLPQLRELASLRVDGGVLHTATEVRALYRAPTTNLQTASAATRRSARARWGAVINGLPHPVQIVVHGAPATAMPVIERIRAQGSSQAIDLAAWLKAHLAHAPLVSRERFIVVPAPDMETLTDRCADIESSMRRMGLPIERLAGADLTGALQALLTPRPRGARLGPASAEVHASYCLVDGEYMRAFDVGKLPPSILTDWASPLLDGDLPLDISIDIQPLDLTWAKLQLDARRNALESSSPTPARQVAVEQISGLRMAYERRTTLPQQLSITVVVRGSDRATLERRSRRLIQRTRDLGATLRLLRWEQRAGWLAVAPMRRPSLGRRGLPVESGCTARTYPFSRAALVLEGGVPFGVAGSSPVTFTVAQPRRAGRKGWRHMVWYGAPGSGKGYQLKTYLSREHFAHGLRVYGIDQDEQGEYTGRFCRYLGGRSVPIRTVDDAHAFHFIGIDHDDVVMFDLHESDESARGEIFAILKGKLVEHLLATPGQRAALIVDEAVTVSEDEAGRKALGDLNRRGRHFGLEMHVLTQRVTDWFDTQIGRTIQNTSANQWYGQMEARELYEFAPSLGISPEERELLDRAGQGEGLLVTAGQRVWVNLYGHTSPGEFEAFNTDRDEGKAVDKNLDRRNGQHELATMVGSARS